MVARFEVWLVRLDPGQGSEIRKTRPALIVSPDEMNRHLRTVVVCPMTTVLRDWPTRVEIVFEGKSGQVAADQIRTIDKARLTKRLGRLDRPDAERVASVLCEMFRL